MVAVHNAVDYVWQRLTRYGYRPELITARESLRIVPMNVDRVAYAAAWDARSNQEIRRRSHDNVSALQG